MIDRERGSVLMLVPAAVLVLVVLASICVDSAVQLLAARRLNSLTTEAANDIASTAISDEAFYRGRGAVELRQADADAVVASVFDTGSRPAGFESLDAAASVQGRQVVVSAHATVRLLFARALPGVAHVATVRAVTRTVLADGT